MNDDVTESSEADSSEGELIAHHRSIISYDIPSIDRIQTWVNQCHNDNDTETTVSSNDYEELNNDQIESINVQKIQNVLSEYNLHHSGPLSFHNSQNIHVGPKIYLNVSNQNNEAVFKIAKRGSRASSKSRDDVSISPSDGFIRYPPTGVQGSIPRLIKRRLWLAQPPRQPAEKLRKPVSYVIISHTATESGETQADNIEIVRTIQMFHIESRRWDDIAYNFLIGCDGYIYEGRGFDAVAAHTRGYNKVSIGISFVGCFMDMRPPNVSIELCKVLIEDGVKKGHIAADYKLYAHCQCTTTESPGKMLFDEIKTWSHWTETPPELPPIK